MPQRSGFDTGVEPAEASLEIAIRKGIKAEKTYGEELPCSNGMFGGVFILLTLCFVKEPGKVIAEAKRVLNNDGGLILGIINRESPWGKLYQAKKTEGHLIYKYARFYSINEVETLLHDAGLTVDGYSSTLCQGPLEAPHEEDVHDRFVDGAGFVGILARRFNKQRVNGN